MSWRLEVKVSGTTYTVEFKPLGVAVIYSKTSLLRLIGISVLLASELLDKLKAYAERSNDSCVFQNVIPGLLEAYYGLSSECVERIVLSGYGYSLRLGRAPGGATVVEASYPLELCDEGVRGELSESEELFSLEYTTSQYIPATRIALSSLLALGLQSPSTLMLLRDYDPITSRYVLTVISRLREALDRGVKLLVELGYEVQVEDFDSERLVVVLRESRGRRVSLWDLPAWVNQVLGLAVFLDENPSTLIVEEPFTLLSIEQARRLAEHLWRARSKTMIILSSSMEAVELLKDLEAREPRGLAIHQLY